MRMIRTALAALALLCAGAISVPALAADGVAVTEGSGKTMGCIDVAGTCYSKVIPTDNGGTHITNTTLHSLVVSVPSTGIASGAIASGAVASGAFASGAYASGSIASGAFASGAVGSGAVASGAFASGSIASGAIVDGADVTQGAKADTACANGASTCSVTALLKAMVTAAQDTTAVAVTGSGSAGSAAAGVVSVQGIASMTPVQVSQATASNLNATATLAAGSALVGKVGIDQTTPGTTNLVSVASSGFSVQTTITRPANTTAYTANDYLGGALDLGVLGPSATTVLITSIQLEADIAAVPSGQTSWVLDFYSVTPPSAVADNGAGDLPSGDRASFLGSVAIAALVDLGATLYVESNGVNKQVKLAGTHLFAYLRTVGAFTPNANSEVYKLTLSTVAL